jgi:hypothetical protein
MGRVKQGEIDKKQPRGKGAGKTPQGNKQQQGNTGAGNRPDLRITAKLDNGGGFDFVPVAAYWRDPDTGFYQGGIDRKVKLLVITTTDGETFELRPGVNGEFLNAYEKNDGASND